MISQFWFHGLRNCFITVAECNLFLPLSLTKRLVNHTRPSDITEGRSDESGGCAAVAKSACRRFSGGPNFAQKAPCDEGRRLLLGRYGSHGWRPVAAFTRSFIT